MTANKNLTTKRVGNMYRFQVLWRAMHTATGGMGNLGPVFTFLNCLPVFLKT
jgi:hypothetical protein